MARLGLALWATSLATTVTYRTHWSVSMLSSARESMDPQPHRHHHVRSFWIGKIPETVPHDLVFWISDRFGGQ